MTVYFHRMWTAEGIKVVNCTSVKNALCILFKYLKTNNMGLIDEWVTLDEVCVYGSFLPINS